MTSGSEHWGERRPCRMPVGRSQFGPYVVLMLRIELALPAFGGRHSRSIVGGEAVCCNGLLIRGRQVTCQSSSGTAPL